MKKAFFSWFDAEDIYRALTRLVLSTTCYRQTRYTTMTNLTIKLFSKINRVPNKHWESEKGTLNELDEIMSKASSSNQ